LKEGIRQLLNLKPSFRSTDLASLVKLGDQVGVVEKACIFVNSATRSKELLVAVHHRLRKIIPKNSGNDHDDVIIVKKRVKSVAMVTLEDTFFHANLDSIAVHLESQPLAFMRLAINNVNHFFSSHSLPADLQFDGDCYTDHPSVRIDYRAELVNDDPVQFSTMLALTRLLKTVEKAPFPLQNNFQHFFHNHIGPRPLTLVRTMPALDLSDHFPQWFEDQLVEMHLMVDGNDNGLTHDSEDTNMDDGDSDEESKGSPRAFCAYCGKQPKQLIFCRCFRVYYCTKGCMKRDSHSHRHGPQQ